MGKEKEQITQTEQEIPVKQLFLAEFLEETQKEYIKQQGLGELSKENLHQESKKWAETVLKVLSKEQKYKEIAPQLISEIKPRLDNYIVNLGEELEKQNNFFMDKIQEENTKVESTIQWGGQNVSVSIDSDYIPMIAALESKFTKIIDRLKKEEVNVTQEIEQLGPKKPDVTQEIEQLGPKKPGLLQQLVNKIKKQFPILFNSSVSKTEQKPVATDLEREVDKTAIAEPKKLNPSITKQLATRVSKNLPNLRKFVSSNSTLNTMVTTNTDKKKHCGPSI